MITGRGGVTAMGSITAVGLAKSHFADGTSSVGYWGNFDYIPAPMTTRAPGATNSPAVVIRDAVQTRAPAPTAVISGGESNCHNVVVLEFNEQDDGVYSQSAHSVAPSGRHSYEHSSGATLEWWSESGNNRRFARKKRRLFTSSLRGGRGLDQSNNQPTASAGRSAEIVKYSWGFPEFSDDPENMATAGRMRREYESLATCASGFWVLIPSSNSEYNLKTPDCSMHPADITSIWFEYSSYDGSYTDSSPTRRSELSISCENFPESLSPTATTDIDSSSPSAFSAPRAVYDSADFEVDDQEETTTNDSSGWKKVGSYEFIAITLGVLLCGVFPVVAAIGRCVYMRRRKARHLAQQSKKITPGHEPGDPLAASTGTMNGYGHATSASVAAGSADTREKDLSSCYAPCAFVAGAPAKAVAAANHVDDDGEQEVKRELRCLEGRLCDVASGFPPRAKRGEGVVVDVAGPAARTAQAVPPASVSTVSTDAVSDGVSAAATVDTTSTPLVARLEAPEGGTLKGGGGRCYNKEEGVHCSRQVDDVPAVPSDAIALDKVGAVNASDNSDYPNDFVMTVEQQKCNEGIVTPTPDAVAASAAAPAAEAAVVTAVGEAAHAGINHLVNDSAIAECFSTRGSAPVGDADGPISRVATPAVAAVTTVMLGEEMRDNVNSDIIIPASGDFASGDFAMESTAESHEVATPTLAHVHIQDPTKASLIIHPSTTGPRPAIPEAAGVLREISAATRASMSKVALPILDVSSVAGAGVHAYSGNPTMAWSTSSDSTATAESPHNSDAAAVVDGASNDALSEESGAALVTAAAVAAAIIAARESICGDDVEDAVSTTPAGALARARAEVHSSTLVDVIASNTSHSVLRTVLQADDSVRAAGTAAVVGIDHKHADGVNVVTEEGGDMSSPSGHGGGLIDVHNFTAIRKGEEEAAAVRERQEDVDAGGGVVVSGDGFDITSEYIDLLQQSAEHFSASGIGLAVGGVGRSDDDKDENSEAEDASGCEGDAYVSNVEMEEAVVGQERGGGDEGAIEAWASAPTWRTQSRR